MGKMSEKIKIVQYGLGPIGIAAAKLARTKNNLELVGGIDIDPAKKGLDLGRILGLGKDLGTLVSDDPEALFAETEPDVVLHSTGSFLDRIAGQFETCIKSHVSVISSCEELFYPYHRHAKLSQKLDAMAREHRVTVMGTGVNPGFSMDVLALTMTSVCSDIKKIRANRIVDASKRRLPLQKKIGAGLTPAEFRKLVDDGKLGHIGLVESLVAVAASIGWDLDEVKESIDPKLAEKSIMTPYLSVEPGQVAGIWHVARGLKGGEEIITLDLQMFVGAENPADIVQIDGEPPINLKVDGGIFGDTATVARMVNAIPVVQKSEPGLKTPIDIGIPCFVH